MPNLPTGGIISEVEDRGSGSKGVAYHTLLRHGLVSLYDMLPLTPTPPTFHLPNNTPCELTCVIDENINMGLFSLNPARKAEDGLIASQVKFLKLYILMATDI